MMTLSLHFAVKSLSRSRVSLVRFHRSDVAIEHGNRTEQTEFEHSTGNRTVDHQTLIPLLATLQDISILLTFEICVDKFGWPSYALFALAGISASVSYLKINRFCCFRITAIYH